MLRGAVIGDRVHDGLGVDGPAIDQCGCYLRDPAPPRIIAIPSGSI